MRWSKEDIETVVSLYKSGKSAGQIAKKFPGVSRNAIIGVWTRARKAGVQSRFRSSSRGLWSDQQSLRLMSLRETDRCSWPKISGIMGRPQSDCISHYEEILRDLEVSERQ